MKPAGGKIVERAGDLPLFGTGRRTSPNHNGPMTASIVGASESIEFSHHHV